MDNKEKEQILQQYYFDEKNPAAYAGAQKLFGVLDKKYPGLFTITGIKQWLNDQDAYSLQKPRRYRFKTANVRVSAIGEQLDIDLLSMANLAEENDGVRFLLCAIDILSRKLWVRPLKNKTAKEVLSAIKVILEDISPTKIKKLRADRGSEFSNQWFRKYMKNGKWIGENLGAGASVLGQNLVAGAKARCWGKTPVLGKTSVVGKTPVVGKASVLREFEPRLGTVLFPSKNKRK
jgi:hypothetical protein